jgi:hypothetical protein
VAPIRPYDLRMRRIPWRLIPLQPSGVLLLALALGAALSFAPREVDSVAYAAALTLLVLLALCFVNTGLATLVLHRKLRRLRSEPLTDAQVGVASRTGFSVPNLGAWPLVQSELSWASPSNVRVTLIPVGTRLDEEVTPLERGRHERIVRRFTVQDSFGLTRFSFTSASEHAVRIAPGPAAASVTQALSHTSGGEWSHPGGPAEGDLVEMRQYGPGDPMRRVLWKTFARSRRLLVRMPESAWAESHLNVAFFVAGERDEASAALARSYVERGLLGRDFLFAADGALAIARNVTDATEQIIDSTKSRASGGEALTTLAAKIEPGRLASSLVFAPARDGPWVEHVIAFVRQRPVSTTTVLIGSDVDLEPPREQTRFERLFLQSNVEPALSDLMALREKLLLAGLRVQIVHRESGRSL